MCGIPSRNLFLKDLLALHLAFEDARISADQFQSLMATEDGAPPLHTSGEELIPPLTDLSDDQSGESCITTDMTVTDW